MIEISKQFRFEASHVLPHHPGKCARLHGHSWLLEVAVQGEVHPSSGFVMDYAVLSTIVEGNIIDLVDHRHLGHGKCGEFEPVFGRDFYPSSENLVGEFATRLQPIVYNTVGRGQVQLSRVKLYETCTSAAEWRREWRVR